MADLKDLIVHGTSRFLGKIYGKIDMADKDGDGNTISTSYLSVNGGTVKGTTVFSRTTDASGTANNKPALIVGGTDAQ